MAIIGTTILASVGVNIWQENKAKRTAEMLQSLGTPIARVLRDGQVKSVPSNQVVPRDILMLAHGDRVVLAGSDVTSGTARAIAVAVGNQTRMGATVAALSTEERETSPLSTRLAHMLRVFLPVSLAGGVTVIMAGFLWGQPLNLLLATGATIAFAGVPEGLPLLAKVGETGVARRDVGRSEGHITRSVSTAVAGSAAVLLAALTVPPVRDFLNLAMLSPLGWALVGGGAVTAAGLSWASSSRGVS